MHTLYTTDAIVLSNTPYREADRLLFLLTEQHGFIRTHAQGVRLERSKLRYMLMPGTCIRVTLVRGREIWRLTGAMELSYPSRAPTLKARRAEHNVCAVLRRLVQGEGEGGALFGIVVEGFRALRTAHGTHIDTCEAILMARVLAQLGYLRFTPETQSLVTGVQWNDEMLALGSLQSTHLVQSVNEALRECQL